MSWLERIDEREARRIARSVRSNALQTRDAAQEHLAEFAHQARAIAEPTLQHTADFALKEGAVVAKAVARQAGRATRAVRADPVPAIVGAVALALFASLVLGRRRS